jgi:hypothetical protein
MPPTAWIHSGTPGDPMSPRMVTVSSGDVFEGCDGYSQARVASRVKDLD